jgi:transcriptional antiterminator RfaH
MERWFAVCCKPREELIAQENLLRQQFHVYLPRIRVRRWRRGKWVEVIEALFPRYVFIRVDTSRQSTATVRSTRGAVGLVSFGGTPAVIGDDVMEALFLRENAEGGLHQDSRPQFAEGQAVRLVGGPLAGMEGLFAQEDGEKRVVILLDLLGKCSKMKVSRDWIVQAA